MKGVIIGILLVTTLISMSAAYNTNKQYESLQQQYKSLQGTTINRPVNTQYLNVSSKKGMD